MTIGMNPGQLRRRGLLTARQVAALTIAVALVLPLVWMVALSVREIGRPLPRQLEGIPRPAEIHWENYGEVFGLIDFARFAANSGLVVLIATPLTLVTASMAGFALAQISQRWRLRLTGLSLAALMIPITAVWLPRFVLYKEVGLIDNRLSLVVPAFTGTSPAFVLLFLWAFLRVPREVYEAARLDGAGAVRVWLGIAMPLARPTIVAVAVLAAVYYYSAFIEPLLYINSTDKMTLPLALNALLQLDRSNWPLLMAGTVMVTVPVMVLFALAQRVFLQQYRGSGWLGR
ncbi:MAG: hypothetical protein AVDCRST_MAG33-3109 [uncultured Thermomicrobiales bacterium]|uniref:ABC transmembrane type-1 domain-containing protein n=1 Tax=uncultured Thermomicrobiales bacterium TaxID=1645740 RepID=A0A6J4VI35_9BACT|nr:MAG: hypothetical protein AVDCRST_MAG33-3109 [uncultured Thermomicrobiales bacterium]